MPPTPSATVSPPVNGSVLLLPCVVVVVTRAAVVVVVAPACAATTSTGDETDCGCWSAPVPVATIS